MIDINDIKIGSYSDNKIDKFFVLVVNGLHLDVFDTLEEAKKSSEVYKRHLVKIYVFEPTLVFS